MTILTIKEAYLAMYQFMTVYALRDRHEGFLDMIGSMSFLRDGSTADSGMWYDWEQAINRINKNLTDWLTVDEAHAAMRSFLETYNARSPEESITQTLSQMTPTASGEQGNSTLWKEWLDAVRAAKAQEVDADLHLIK
jgi:hypothetical protein